MYDIIIKNGTIVDGSGAPPWVGDIAVMGDRIVAVSSSIREAAATVVDAKRKLVIPGLIDPHVHEEWVVFDDGVYDLFLKQGVTTVVNGNCGHSILPGPTKSVVGYYFNNGLLSIEQRDRYLKNWPEWDSFEGYAEAVERKGTNINFVTLLGYGTIRELIMGGAIPREPSGDEWRRIEATIRSGIEDGMWGLSHGLDYIPGRYAGMDELVRVSKIVAEYDCVSAAHMRQSAGIPESTGEFLEIGRRSGSRLQLSHLRSTCAEAFEMTRRAVEDEGIRARIDTIPRSTGHCMSKKRLRQFIIALSDELFGKGESDVVEALHNPEGRAGIKRCAFILAGSKDEIFVVNSDDPALENRSVADIALERGVDPNECILDLVGDDNRCVFWLGGPSRDDFPVEGHADIIVNNPYVSAGSDRVMGDTAEDPFDWYELQRIGCHAVFMQMYRSKGVPVEEIVRRNTSMIAEHFGIAGRGVLRCGAFADITVLDLENYRFPAPDQLHYKTPGMRASGVEQVLVNGKFALRDGRSMETYAGRVLKKAKRKADETLRPQS
jgi:N-acyl-D-aspartate/D-glutamate deacylase